MDGKSKNVGKMALITSSSNLTKGGLKPNRRVLGGDPPELHSLPKGKERARREVSRNRGKLSQGSKPAGGDVPISRLVVDKTRDLQRRNGKYAKPLPAVAGHPRDCTSEKLDKDKKPGTPPEGTTVHLQRTREKEVSGKNEKRDPGRGDIGGRKKLQENPLKRGPLQGGRRSRERVSKK